MRSNGTGPRYRSELETMWPQAQDRVSDVKVAQVRDPLHLCEIPESMYPARERLASVWAGLTPPKSVAKSTSADKGSRTQKNTKKKGWRIGESR